MSRIIKVPSRQNTQPTATQNLVDFDLPSGQYDLSKSYFVLNSSLASANQNSINLLKLVTTDAAGNADPTMRDSTIFVRHAKLRSSMKGQLENNRHINLLRLNQKTYEQSISNITSQALMTGIEVQRSINNLSGSHYRNINKLGTILSSDKTHNYVIRCKDVLNFCKNDYYDTEDKGELSIGLELNLDNLAAVQALAAADNYMTRTPDGGPANGALANIAGAGTITAGTAINTQRPFPDLQTSPYYVGQRLILTGGNLTGTGVTQRQITSISKNADNTLAIAFDTDIVSTNAVNDLTAAFVDEANLATKQPVFNFIELVLVQVPKQSPRDYEYTTYRLQEDTINTTALNKTYMISPMTKNVYVCTPDDNVQLLSNTQINSYRFGVDNKLTTNRAIQFGAGTDSLHQLQVLKTYDNKDEKLTSLTGKELLVSAPGQEDGGVAQKSFMVMQPVPITPGKAKLLSLELNSQAAMGRVLIFEEEVKML